MKSLAVRAHGKSLELACRIAPEVPHSVLGDSARLRQIVINLVGNAIKFTEKGEVVLEVSRETETESGVVLHFAVRDTGIGIPKQKLSIVFEAFEQADTGTTRRYGGTGLGLAISRRLTEFMGGRIWVESEEGCGSTFHFTAQIQPRRRGTASTTRRRTLGSLRGAGPGRQRQCHEPANPGGDADQLANGARLRAGRRRGHPGP